MHICTHARTQVAPTMKRTKVGKYYCEWDSLPINQSVRNSLYQTYLPALEEGGQSAFDRMVYKLARVGSAAPFRIYSSSLQLIYSRPNNK